MSIERYYCKIETLLGIQYVSLQEMIHVVVTLTYDNVVQCLGNACQTNVDINTGMSETYTCINNIHMIFISEEMSVYKDISLYMLQALC